MATGAEHYLVAEARLEQLANYEEGKAGELLLEAQVHATLALAAAIGVSMPATIDGETAMRSEDITAWIKAAGEPNHGAAD